MEIIDIILIIIGAAALVLLVLVLNRFSAVQKEIKESRVETIQYINNSFRNFGEDVYKRQEQNQRREKTGGQRNLSG